MADRDRLQRLEYDVALVSRQIAGLPVRIGDSGAENFRLIRGESVGAQSGATILIDNVVVLSGGLDPSGGNPATQVRVANLFGQSFSDNEKVQAIYSPGVVASPLTDWEAIKTISGTETYRLVRGLVKGAVTADDATFVVDNVTPLAGGLDPVSGNPATELEIFNSQLESFRDNAPITAIYDGLTWQTIIVERRRLIRGQAVGAVSGSGTFSIDNIVVWASGLDPRTDPTNAAETVTVSNAVHSESYTDNEIVEAVFNVVANQWEAMRKSSSTGQLFVCELNSTIAGRSGTTMGTGSGTVYTIGAGSTLTAIGGTQTIYNPFLFPMPDSVPGGTVSYTCIKTHESAWTITGVDPVYILASLTGFAQHKILWASAAASPVAEDMEWAGAECTAT